jgi:hypothetical protein
VSAHGPYRLVKLAGGVHSVHSVAHHETFHPVIGPVAEAEALYVGQLRLRERLRAQRGKFVVWDVGLGAAANALTVLRAARRFPCSIRLISFDLTLGALEFGLGHAAKLGYFKGYEERLRQLAADGRVVFQDGESEVDWELRLGDFPTLVAGWLAAPEKPRPPAPQAILFDAFSPAKNPAMWTQPLFAGLFRLLDPRRPCALPTYSRSTMLRVSLLLAGFYVGTGHATGEKEETTLAANTLELVEEPLGARWLERARHSTSAEPLWEPVYRQARLTAGTWDKLRRHPQFQGKRGLAGGPLWARFARR